MGRAGSRLAQVLPAAALALVLVFASMPAASAHPGDVDSTFGTGGWTGVTVGTSPRIAGIVRRADASLITGSSPNGSSIFQTVALTANGQPLSGYGVGGLASVTIPGASSVSATDIALQSDGRVIVAGYALATTGTDMFVVARFRLHGAPDPSFSGDGVATIRFPQGDAFGYGVAVQPDGKIVVVGEVDPTGVVSNPAVIRLNPNGTLDKTFGNKGRKMLKVPDHVRGFDSPWRVAIGPAGNIVMAGWDSRNHANSSFKTLVMRLGPKGAPDRTFSGDGFVVLDADGTYNYANAMALDGSKVVAGLYTSSGTAGFLRLLPNGRRDTTFGGDGVVLHSLSTSFEVGALAVMSDHRILATSDNSGDPNVLRLLPGGYLDTSFGTNGQANGLVAGSEGWGIRILPVGKIVVVGTASNQVIVTRLLPLAMLEYPY